LANPSKVSPSGDNNDLPTKVIKNKLMLSFFDNVFYRFCRFYFDNEKEGGKISALVLLSLTQFLNLAALIILFGVKLKTRSEIVTFSIIGYFAILVINGFRYNKIHYDILHQRWINKSASANKWGIWLARMYLILTVLFMLILINRNVLF